MSAQKSVDKLVTVEGNTITYTITITNSGQVPAEDIVVQDNFTSGLTYVSGSLSANVPVSGDPLNTISVIDPIVAGATITITFQVTADPPFQQEFVTNQATVTYRFTPGVGVVPFAGTTITNSVATRIFAASRGVLF